MKTGPLSIEEVQQEVRQHIIDLAIKQAMPSFFGFFSVCPIHKAAAMLGLSPNYIDSNSYRILRSFHCVDRWKIPKEVRQKLPILIRDILT